MADKKDRSKDEKPQGQGDPLCTCVTDPYASLPAELRPRPKETMGGLRKVTCPGCGLVYWTNRNTDLCVDCEKKGIRLPDAETKKGG